MELTAVREGETLIVALSGRIDGANAPQIQKALEDALAPEDRGLVLDMEGVTFMSSAGLRIVAIMINRTRAKKTRFALCSLSGSVMEVLATSGFGKMVPVLKTLDEARASVAA